MRRAPAIYASSPGWVSLAIAGLVLFTGIALVMGGLGVAGYVNTRRLSTPATGLGFRRDFAQNCNDGFYCVYATDPNPSYIAFNLPPFSDGINNYQFANLGGVFELVDNETVLVKQGGTYCINFFLPVFVPDTSAQVAVVVTANDGMIFMTPAVGGAAALTETFGLVGNLSLATISFGGIAHFTGETTLRIAYNVNADALFAPSGYWAMYQLSAD